MHFNYLLTPGRRVLLEKLTGLQQVKKFPTFHGTRRFITALISVHHLSVSWANPIQSIYPHPTSWRSILISTHLRLGLPSGLFPSGFPRKTLYTPSPHPYAPHAQPISFFSILSPAQYWMRCTLINPVDGKPQWNYPSNLNHWRSSGPYIGALLPFIPFFKEVSNFLPIFHYLGPSRECKSTLLYNVLQHAGCLWRMFVILSPKPFGNRPISAVRESRLNTLTAAHIIWKTYFSIRDLGRRHARLVFMNLYFKYFCVYFACDVRHFEGPKFSKIAVCLCSLLLEFADYIAHFKRN